MNVGLPQTVVERFGQANVAWQIKSLLS